MDEEKWLCGLRIARSLNFTDAQYEEAVKRIDTPEDRNQLLVALLDVSSNSYACCTNQYTTATTDNEFRNAQNNSITSTSQERDSSSSCYSSITSFPSSSDQSLESIQPTRALRKVYIDGSNIARSHSQDASFSWTGIKLCVDWFCSRSHSVKVFVPQDKCQQADKTTLSLLRDLNALVETPIGCNDDSFIIEAARQNNAIIVSNDLFRDEKRSNDELDRFIHLNRLPYIFVDDTFIPANDPRGRLGPKLDDFLSADFNDYGSNQYQTNRLLGRTKSHQRYQRKKDYSITNQQQQQQQHHQNVYQRSSLQSTRSLPIEQNRTVVIDNIQQPSRCANQQQQQQLPTQSRNYHPNLDSLRHKEVRRTVSVVYTNSNTKESDAQSMMAGRGKTALCRTKSHNI